MNKQENSHTLFYIGLQETHAVCRILKDKVELPVLYSIGLHETYWFRFIAAEVDPIWGPVFFRSFRKNIQEIYE